MRREGYVNSRRRAGCGLGQFCKEPVCGRDGWSSAQNEMAMGKCWVAHWSCFLVSERLSNDLSAPCIFRTSGIQRHPLGFYGSGSSPCFPSCAPPSMWSWYTVTWSCYTPFLSCSEPRPQVYVIGKGFFFHDPYMYVCWCWAAAVSHWVLWGFFSLSVG